MCRSRDPEHNCLFRGGKFELRECLAAPLPGDACDRRRVPVSQAAEKE